MKNQSKIRYRTFQLSHVLCVHGGEHEVLRELHDVDIPVWDAFQPEGDAWGFAVRRVDVDRTKQRDVAVVGDQDPPAHLGDMYAESGQTLQGSFSAVSKPNFASKYSLESSRRDLHNALLCTDL